MDLVNYLEKQWKLITGFAVAVLVVGGIFVLIKTQNEKKEKLAQESYFAVEKKLIQLKTKKANNEAEAKTKKNSTVATVDFTDVKKDLEKITLDFPNSIAAQMAAIHLANLLVEEKNFDTAFDLLKKAETKDSGLVNTLLQQQLGQLMADKNNCKDAIDVWQKILNRKEAVFIHDEIKIQQALCYAKLNDLKKAEEILTNLANQTLSSEAGNANTAKEAEKFLRLIQFKKASGT